MLRRPTSGVNEGNDRRAFIAVRCRVTLGNDEEALLRLWRQKRGAEEPEGLPGNLIVQLGVVTEHLNRHWYERHTGQEVTEVQRFAQHPGEPLDGGDHRRVEESGAVFEAKFTLPWSFSEDAVSEKHKAQLQHNMWVTNAKEAVLRHHRPRQVGRDHSPCGLPLPAPSAHRGEEILALRAER